MNPSPETIAATLLWEMYGNRKIAIEYCNYIGTPLYIEVANILSRGE